MNAISNRHFLVVDDEAFIRTVVKSFLQDSGAAAVVEAADGAAAIAAIAGYDLAFDAVISDVNMHPVNGVELLRAIRTGVAGVRRNTPVLMLTVHAEAELVAAALDLDADAFVVKPVHRQALVERVGQILEQTVPIQAAAHYAVGGPCHDERARGRSPARAGMPDGELVAQKTALGDIQPNSILADDLYLSDTSRLFLAAPVVLTKALLDRIKDLHDIFGSYSHLFVVEPIGA